jgi:spore coat polysaccharide biosynthesis predicted glycosyltransferase SpsG
MVVLAPNQRSAAAALAEREAAVVVDAQGPAFEDQFDRQFARLMRDGELRAQLGRASAEVCDGLGGPRVAEAFLKLVAARA